MNLFHFFLETFLVDFILNFIADILLFGIPHLIDLEQFLALSELLLLFFKLLPHADLAITLCNLLLLFFLEGLQNSILVQSSPLIDLVLESTHYTSLIIIPKVLSDTISHHSS